MQFSGRIDEVMMREAPGRIMDIFCAQVAKEMADNYMTALSEGMVENPMTEEDIKAKLIEITAKQIAEMQFNFKIKEPSVEPVSEVVKENKESAVDGMRRMRGAKI